MAIRDVVRGGWSELLDLVLPRPCPGCGGPEPWCGTCATTLTGRPRQVLPPAFGADAAPPLYALARYHGPVRGGILAGKEHGRADLPPRLGEALGAGIERLIRIGAVAVPLWLVPAPTRPSAARRRGGDPVARMVRSAAAGLARRGIPCGVAPCLHTGRGTVDSVGLDASQRRTNLVGKIIFTPTAGPPRSQSVILLDDVITTGATCLESVTVLAAQGHPVSAVLALASATAFVTDRVPAPPPP
ncbi:ComF family protein [Nakamurella silvestris]|nr:ComF family protein [Nakamurella silvestris]